MLDKENPCKDCIERFIGCHSTCEKRKVYLGKYYALKQKINDEKKKFRDVDDFLFSSRIAHKKSKRE